MNKFASRYAFAAQARKAYAEGRNVSQMLREQNNISCNTPEVIEMAYDLQAGSYIKNAEQNRDALLAYIDEMAEIINRHVAGNYSLLDIGTGELTTLGLLTPRLGVRPTDIYAFDISWSRLHKGVGFAREVMGDDYQLLTPFVADIAQIPLRDKSISVTISSHALEPNGGSLATLMQELFRVTADTLILFEPCYEINSDEGKARMERLGYIKDLSRTVEALGGTVVEEIRIQAVSNPLNPTVGFVITPAKRAPNHRQYAEPMQRLAVPGTDFALQKKHGVYFSEDTGFCFFELKAIPILTSSSALLASALGGPGLDDDVPT